MPHLMRQFESAGGEIIQRRIQQISDLSSYNVVVNCTGLGAGQLVKDESVQPLRGQVMRVQASWLRRMVLDDRDDGNYVIPNIDTVVVGGTHQYADWDTVGSNILLFGQMRRNLLKKNSLFKYSGVQNLVKIKSITIVHHTGYPK